MRETGLGDRPYGALVAAPEVVAGVGRLRKFEQIPPAPDLVVRLRGTRGMEGGVTPDKGVFCRPLISGSLPVDFMVEHKRANSGADALEPSAAYEESV